MGYDQSDNQGKKLEKTCQLMEEENWLSDAPRINLRGDSPNKGAMETTIQTVEAQVQLLEKRVVGRGVSMGNFVSQMFEDLNAWAKTHHVPENRFSQFVDGISFFEFFSYDHSDTNQVIPTFHNSQKNGFITMFKAHFTNLMQNMLLTEKIGER